MVAPLLAPNPLQDTTSGVPWSPSYAGPRYTTRSTGFYPQQPGYGNGVDYVTPEQYAQAIETAKQTLRNMAGGATPFERQVQAEKIADLQRGYANSLKIAQLQADTSRYGYDQTRQTALDQLKQADRQFAANHDLDVRKQQLDEASLIAQQRSQPNRLFQTMDLEQALGSIRNGQRATTMPMTTGIAALDGLSTDYTGNPYLAAGGNVGQLPARDGGQGAGGGNPYLAGGSGGGGGATTSVYDPNNPSGGATTGAAAPDPRMKALKAVFDALPPSATEGLDPTGVAALNAAYHLYAAPSTIRPGTMESLSPTQQATAQSAADRLQRYTGRSWADIQDQYSRNAPRQGDVRAA